MEGGEEEEGSVRGGRYTGGNEFEDTVRARCHFGFGFRSQKNGSLVDVVSVFSHPATDKELRLVISVIDRDVDPRPPSPCGSQDGR